MNFFSVAALSSWATLAIAGWVVVATYVSLKGGWFQYADSSSFFPFTFKQFCWTFFGLVCALSTYLFSMYVAHNLINAFRHSSLSELVSPRTRYEWIGIEQLVGLIITTSGIHVLMSLLPSEPVSISLGQEGGWKKWVKGALYGILFYPLISLVAVAVRFFVQSFTSSEGTPQVALALIGGLERTSILYWLVVLSIIFLVPYIEELLFRGFLQGFLGGIFHPLITVIGTSFVFSIFHYSSLQKSSNFEIIAGLFVFSLFLSRLRVKENTVTSCIGMHTAFNAISLALFMS